MNLQPIAIFGAPRSGTSWLGQIFNSSQNVAYRFQPLFSFSFKGRLNEKSSREDISKFYGELLETEDSFVLQSTNVSGRKETSFSKIQASYLVWKEVRYLHIIENILQQTDTRIIGIIRHPCGVINSWINAPKEFNKEWEPLEEWRLAVKKNNNLAEEFNGYEKWKEAAIIFKNLEKRYPEKFTTIVYENLVENTEVEIERLFKFCGLQLQEQTLDFIRKSKSTESADPYGVLRKSQDTLNWQKELHKEIVHAITTDSEFLELKEYFKWKI